VRVRMVWNIDLVLRAAAERAICSSLACAGRRSA